MQKEVNVTYRELKSICILYIGYILHFLLFIFKVDGSCILNISVTGHLTGSVGGGCDSWSQGSEFEPFIGYRDCINNFFFKNLVPLNILYSLAPMDSCG